MNTIQPLPAALGRFRIDGELGRGGMGVVYRAFDPVVERPVAIKIITDLERAGARSLDRLRREAKAVGSLEHPNIVALFDAGDSEGVLYLVMQLVEGETLRERLDRQRTFGGREILDILRQLLAALEYAHARGIVHRDVKPANVLITTEGTVKLTDFGVARVSGPQLSTTGLVVGTPSYMSPEQMIGATVDRRSDIFAVGCILYELAFGRKPFAASSTTGVMYQVVHGVPAIPFPPVPGVPAGLDAVVMKALEKEPADRYQSCTDLLCALQTCLADVRCGSVERQDAGATGIVAASPAEWLKGTLRNSPAVGILMTVALLSPALVLAPLLTLPAKVTIGQPRPPSAPLPEPPDAGHRILEPASPDTSPLPEARVAEPYAPAMRKATPAARRPPRSEARRAWSAPVNWPATPDAPGTEIANFSALMVNGDLAFQNDRYDEALRFYRKALLLNPSDDAVRRRLARTLTMVGQAEPARKYSH